jgi:hypothetical protein
MTPNLMEQDEPNRENEEIDRELPSVTESKTVSSEPNLLAPDTDTLEPNLA